MKLDPSSFVATGILFLLSACGDASAPAAPAPPAVPTAPPPTVAPDAGVVDDDPVDPTYPAPHSALPLVDYNGGAILHQPSIVTVTFDSDPLRDRLEEFGDGITKTPWWDAVASEYCDSANQCIGHGSGGGHVHLVEPPAAVMTDSSRGGDSSIQDFIRSNVADGTFPSPTADTLYTIYLPTGTKVTLDGSKSCRDFGAYHNSLSLAVPSGADAGAPSLEVAYAIMPRCGGGGGEEQTTISASHEIIEAATDPHVSNTGDIAFYMRNEAWTLAGGEVGDLCEGFGGGSATYVEGTFTVQRSWSNKAAKASTNPCVPVPPGMTYFNTALKKGDAVLSMAVGQKKTITLEAFSEAPVADWSLRVVDFAQFRNGTSSVDFELDKDSAHNGSKRKLTITLKSEPADGYVAYGIISSSDNASRYWPGLINIK